MVDDYSAIVFRSPSQMYLFLIVRIWNSLSRSVLLPTRRRSLRQAKFAFRFWLFLLAFSCPTAQEQHFVCPVSRAGRENAHTKTTWPKLQSSAASTGGARNACNPNGGGNLVVLERFTAAATLGRVCSAEHRQPNKNQLVIYTDRLGRQL
jgi:hypothetical protein